MSADRLAKLVQLQPEIKSLQQLIDGALAYSQDPNKTEAVEGYLLEAVLTKLDAVAYASPIHQALRLRAQEASLESERLRGALARLADDAEAQHCPHENTHRGGVLWTICEDCGAEWADDRGGFVPYETPEYIRRARAALTSQEARHDR